MPRRHLAGSPHVVPSAPPRPPPVVPAPSLLRGEQRPAVLLERRNPCAGLTYQHPIGHTCNRSCKRSRNRSCFGAQRRDEKENEMTLDLRGLNPAPVTPFTEDGDVDYDAIQRLGSWLGSIDGVKSLVVLGH